MDPLLDVYIEHHIDVADLCSPNVYIRFIQRVAALPMHTINKFRLNDHNMSNVLDTRRVMRWSEGMELVTWTVGLIQKCNVHALKFALDTNTVPGVQYSEIGTRLKFNIMLSSYSPQNTIVRREDPRIETLTYQDWSNLVKYQKLHGFEKYQVTILLYHLFIASTVSPELTILMSDLLEDLYDDVKNK